MGSTPARTRLYQIAIARELAQALELFDIKGLTKTKKIAPPTHTLLPRHFYPLSHLPLYAILNPLCVAT